MSEINRLYWDEKLRERFMDETDIDEYNRYIDFHNQLEDDSIPKSQVRKLLEFAIKTELIDILWIEINLKTNNKSLNDNVEEVTYLTWLVTVFKRIYKDYYWAENVFICNM